MPFSFRSLGLKNRPDEVPPELLKQLLRDARFIDPEDMEFANSLHPEAGDYLSPSSLRALIRDEVDAEKVSLEIDANKTLLRRFSLLLPALSDLFSPRDPDNLAGFLSCIDDCCGDYHASTQSLRKDRQLRETCEALNAASQRLASAIEAIQVAQRFIESDYEKFHDLYFRPSEDHPQIDALPAINHKREHYPSIPLLTQEMRVCQGVLDIVHARASIDPDGLFISGNDGKSRVVKYAHTMTQMWNGPAISTTPGSDFALLCSLLFECAIGKATESLAGAINRYARSPQRFREEQEEAEFRDEESSEDNFIEEKTKMRLAAQRMEECKCLIHAGTLSKLACNLLLLDAKRDLKNIEAATKIYGPRQVRMSQLSEFQLAEITPIGIDTRALAKLDIELGNIRRSKK